MHEFHRVFERDDVAGLGFVDLVKDGGERRGFAGAGRAGDEDQAGFFLRQFLEDFRQAQLFQRRNLRGQLAQDGGKISALRKDVDAETRPVGERVSRVAGTVLQKVFDELQIVADDVQGDCLHLERREFLDWRIELDGF